MKVAVTFENGKVFPYFGKTSQFLVADVENNNVANEQILSTNGSGHGALAALLKGWGIDTVICGGIGQGAINALEAQGISIIRGVEMDARMALLAFANQALVDDPSRKCTHHEHEEGHDCGSHTCQ